jgi:O-antigen biosynthesis protein
MFLLKRARQLLPTSLYIIRYRGILVFIKYFVGWVGGKRTGINTTQLTDKFNPAMQMPDNKELHRQSLLPTPNCFAIVTPVHEPNTNVWKQTIASVLAQSYNNWVWYIVDASPTDNAWITLGKYWDERLRPVRIHENKGISGNTNIALRKVSEPWVVFLDHDDELAPHALFKLNETLEHFPDADVLYSDYDKISQSGDRFEPFFKPDWSTSTLLCANIITHLSCVRTNIITQVGLLDPNLDGSQDWDLFLRIQWITNNFVHIPHILYHWRVVEGSVANSLDAKPYARNAQIRLLTNYLQRNGMDDVVVMHDMKHPIRNTYPISSWKLTPIPTVEIIYHVENTKNFLSNISWMANQLQGVSHQIKILTSPVYKTMIENSIGILFKQYEVIIYENYSQLANVRQMLSINSKCDLLLFLDSSITITNEGKLSSVWQWFSWENVACVGVKIIDESASIIHSGYITNSEGEITPLYVGLKEFVWSQYGSDCWYRNVPVISDHFSIVKTAIFIETNGFNTALPLSKQTFDFSRRVNKHGYVQIYTPDVVCIKH